MATAPPCGVRVLSSGDSANSRAPLGFRPSPLHTRLGASSAYPKRLWIVTADTLVAESRLSTLPSQGRPPPSARQRDWLLPSRVPSAVECDRGALAAVSHDHSFHSRFRGHESSTTRHLRAALPPRIGFRALLSTRSRPAFAFRAERRRHRSSDGVHPTVISCGRSPKSLRFGGASLADVCLVHPIREHDRRIAEPHWRRCYCLQDPFGARWQAFFLSNRVGGVWLHGV